MKILAQSYLIAPNSPKKAFYHIRVEQNATFRYVVTKESGGGNTVWDQRKWEFRDQKAAIAFYLRKIRDKTNPKRRSPRKYQHQLQPTH
ncbi:hypothetical protein SAMN02746041_03247 [Desulfacinum hydrothermale DSM 13146]|uniref:WGR domain-containing protein n=1 Tax=Desulfacinum hydrothermale DSM 13146 TaxID=1121390 RepID=A0A1W1XWY1_9BACT|nr:hypothetical protein SAMN02746041_03247 [Desulfacinum hydrothermale DSM 13146]